MVIDGNALAADRLARRLEKKSLKGALERQKAGKVNTHYGMDGSPVMNYAHPLTRQKLFARQEDNDESLQPPIDPVAEALKYRSVRDGNPRAGVPGQPPPLAGAVGAPAVGAMGIADPVGAAVGRAAPVEKFNLGTGNMRNVATGEERPLTAGEYHRGEMYQSIMPGRIKGSGTYQEIKAAAKPRPLSRLPGMLR